jgi:hypothetical protein
LCSCRICAAFSTTSTARPCSRSRTWSPSSIPPSAPSVRRPNAPLSLALHKDALPLPAVDSQSSAQPRPRLAAAAPTPSPWPTRRPVRPSPQRSRCSSRRYLLHPRRIAQAAKQAIARGRVLSLPKARPPPRTSFQARRRRISTRIIQRQGGIRIIQLGLGKCHRGPPRERTTSLPSRLKTTLRRTSLWQRATGVRRE